MADSSAPRLRFALFSGYIPGAAPMVLWDQPGQRDFNYTRLGDWTALAQSLEKARFDAIFWADHSGVHEKYQDSWRSAVEYAVQYPAGDPLLLAAALTPVTQNLGFAFSANTIQNHPYNFARMLSTLDQLTEGRIAWNIVTSFQESAWRNLGHEERADHAGRYEAAEEYITVLYKLLEGSWDEGSVVRDLTTRRYADPDRVHEIRHKGARYSVPGIHASEPSPQRTPLLFQAGTSEDGRAFASRNAEAVFMKALDATGAERLVSDMSGRLTAAGRSPEDLLYFQAVRVVLGETEADAKRKDAELQEFFHSETNLVMQSSMMDRDLSVVELDSPIGDYKGDALQGKFKALAESETHKHTTFRQVVLELGNDRFIGSAEQFADHLEMWRDAGVSGVNLTNYPGMTDLREVLEYTAPVLQERGLLQREYAPGTLREKMFGSSATGPLLNDRHPAARYRSK